MLIGKCRKDEKGGYGGKFATLMMQSKFRLEPRDKGADYVVLGEGNAEIGAAWHRSGEWGSYLSLRLDCPALPAAISATMKLTPSEDGWYFLRWNRRSENGNGRGERSDTSPDRPD